MSRSKHREEPIVTKAAPETQGFQSQQRGRLKVYPGLISVSPGVLVFLRTMLLSKVDVACGHKASKSGSLSSKQCQKLSRVLNTFLSSLNQLVLWLTTYESWLIPPFSNGI